jgi:cbb3-type cytochrome oxidase maturation protein
MTYMDEATIALTAMSLVVFLVFVGLLIWGLKSGQFQNIEDPKYRILEENEYESRKES